MVGPSVATMEQFLLDVRSFTTDFGVESLMCDVKTFSITLHKVLVSELLHSLLLTHTCFQTVLFCQTGITTQ
jgi:hypothetical protein